MDDSPNGMDRTRRQRLADVAMRLSQFYSEGSNPGLSTWLDAENDLLGEVAGLVHEPEVPPVEPVVESASCRPEIPTGVRPSKDLEFAGADWVRRSMGTENMSSLGAKVADILGVVYGGIYHIKQKALDRVNWTHPMWIEIRIWDSFSTHDFNKLTALVFACHDAAVRVDISGNSPSTLRLMFHERKRKGGMAERHPTAEEALETWGEAIGDALMFHEKDPRNR